LGILLVVNGRVNSNERSKMKELIKGVKSYALRNYHWLGWDVVFDSYSDERIREIIEDEMVLSSILTLDGAIEAVRRDVGAGDFETVAYW
jgi:hypothetical protein